MPRFLPLILCLLLAACADSPKKAATEVKAADTTYNVQEGDILFQDLDCGDACEAIERVTEGVNGWDFSHCGIVARINDTLKVVEAYGDVQAVTIGQFMNRSKDSTGQPKVVIGRLKEPYQALALNSASIAREYIGKAYDKAFKLNDDAYYCSELVYEAFKKANKDSVLFPLNVMTFKEPGSNDFMPFWVTYYKDLNQRIPEGDSGINPGAISRNDKLTIVPVNTNQSNTVVE